MDAIATELKNARRPRFRRASEPPAFRLTDNDIEIVRHIARHRFIGSSAIAELVDRSIDRTNDRLMRLYHAGYIDRPRAQLDRFPTSGSSRIVYALADRGARLLRDSDGASFANLEWSRKNREAGRPFIEHQMEICEFQVALQRDMRDRVDLQLLHPTDVLAEAPPATRAKRNPFLLHATLSDRGSAREIGVTPDLVFGLRFSDGSRRCFMVEIDRGTMPITRADITQTSFERKMRTYLAAHGAGQHQRQLGWRTFRVLTVTSAPHRRRSLMSSAQSLRAKGGSGPSLFLFIDSVELRSGGPLEATWLDAQGRKAEII